MTNELLAINLQNFKNAQTIDRKFNSLNLIIELEKNDQKYQSLLYKHLKLWMRYYILSIERKKFSYDEIVYTKVYSKISYLKNKSEQLKILNYFIKLLNQFNMNDEVEKYKMLRKKLEIEALLFEKKYTNLFLKLIIYNFSTLIIVLIISILMFSALFYILQEKFNYLSITLVSYEKNIFLNYISNVVAYIFGISNDLELNTFYELIFMSIVKIYFYILITYFIVKEISRKVETI